MMTYNQEKYVRESLRGMLAQTYDPLQIVISDDHSTDGTWDIIMEEVDEYKRLGGEHQILLNRNASNLGIAKHFEKLVSLCNGVLMVCNAGDDISFPNRVGRIVSAWRDSGARAMVIMHDGVKIDKFGKEIGSVGVRNVDAPLGACMAYSRKVFLSFEKIVEEGCFEDHVYGRRGALLGEVLVINDKLVKYRVGSGVSSVLHDRRAPELRSAVGRLASFKQSMIDLKYMRKKSKIDEDRYEKLYERYDQYIVKLSNLLELIGGATFLRRWKAYKNLYVSARSWKQGMLRLPYLLPQKLGDYVYKIHDMWR